MRKHRGGGVGVRSLYEDTSITKSNKVHTRVFFMRCSRRGIASDVKRGLSKTPGANRATAASVTVIPKLNLSIPMPYGVLSGMLLSYGLYLTPSGITVTYIRSYRSTKDKGWFWRWYSEQRICVGGRHQFCWIGDSRCLSVRNT